MRWLLFLLSPGLFAQEPYDLLIRNGRIIDGTGTPWFHGDLAIRGGRIARITPAGLLANAPAQRTIDAQGKLAVTPGFIDIQSHVRANLLGNGDGRLVSKVTQGITTEIMGENETNAPSNDLTRQMTGAKSQRFDGPRGFDAWLRAMQSHGSSANLGSFAGHSTIRGYGKGMAMGKASPAELTQMREAMRNAMLDGAFGLASALIYPPGSYAGTDEIIEVAREIAPFGGVYISHIRSEGERLLEAVDEAINIGKQAGVPVEIYHLKAVGPENWPKIPSVIQKINAARADGRDVAANMYPYSASGTGLTACLPDWTAADGKLFDNLANAQTRKRILAEMVKPDNTWESRCLQATPAGVLLVGLRHPDHKQFVGKRLAEVARAMNLPWPEAALQLLVKEQQRISTIYFVINEANIAEQLKQPWIKVSTDAGASDPEKDRGPVHPRGYGTYPRVLGKYVRDEQVMPLEEAVRKMTSAVANRLSLRDRGLLREGLAADVVIFDPMTVGDRATFEQPHQLASGIPYVIVNGVMVVDDGKHTGAKPGRILRGPGYRPTRD
jgi:dihydroorotase/N-acyl-D-amino-acid deacylase